MKVLLLGGTGAMGKHLVQILASSGVEVTVTSRSFRGYDGNVRYIQGDAQDDAFLGQILKRRWDAIADFMIYSTEKFERRIHLMLRATSQYVFLSSARVYADSPSPLTENSPRLLDITDDDEFLTTDEYSLSKARQENALFRSGSVNWTVIRPYITYGDSRLQLGILEKEGWLYRSLHGRSIVFSKEIASRVTTLTHGFDVGRGMAAVIGNPKALSQTFHITADKSIVWSDVLAIYLDVLEGHLGERPKVSLQELSEFGRIHAHKYQIIYDRLFHRRFDNKKIKEYTGISDFIEPGYGLKESLESFLASPKFRAIDWKGEGVRDRQVGELCFLGEIPGGIPKLRYFVGRYLR